MATENDTTLKKLLDIYQQSKNNGEWASLSLETKGGKEQIHFTLGGPAGNHAGNSWKSQVRRKTPSQLRRDQRRKEEFFAKKKAALDTVEASDTKIEPTDDDDKKATLKIPSDEINLETLESSNTFRIKGQFKDPEKKPWLKKDNSPDEHKAFWKMIDANADRIGLEDFSDGSTYIERFLEFWGDMIVKPDTTEEHLNDLKNWPPGIMNLEVMKIRK